MARHIGILSGGAGTRLWPVSRKNYPKQFLALSGTKEPLIVEAFKRLEAFGETQLISTQDLEKSSRGLFHRFGVEDLQYWAEPEGKNTAPAICFFAQHCLFQDPDAVVGIFPADQFIKGSEEFQKSVEAAFQKASEGHIVTLGIKPNHPSTAYGYIETLENAAPICEVKSFIEKPNQEKATELIKNKNIFWNAGIFIFSAKTLLEKCQEFFPELYQCVKELRTDLSNLSEIYSRVPAESIDFGLMEKIDTLYCVPSDFEWSDLGSWEQVAQYNSGNHHLQIESENTFYYSSPNNEDRSVVFIGCSDQMLIETQDALMVMKKGYGQKVKEALDLVKRDAPEKVDSPTFEERPWGKFEVLKDTDYFKSKKITVLPGKKLSYQSHKHRAEHWIVVKGQAEVVLNDESKKVCAGEHIHIPLHAKHRIANPGNEDLIFIEVQYGSYFGEDDIIRYEDDFGRS